uniref:Uncharacterized protein n=1 Tax=Anguilla anguilla TaxID=7936 RepID=A0A0E9TE23_ANGAN
MSVPHLHSSLCLNIQHIYALETADVNSNACHCMTLSLVHTQSTLVMCSETGDN